MNFLQIAQRVRQECGVSGDGPTNVGGQSGMYKKIVDWVLAAHEDIQLRHDRWKFDWGNVSTALTQGQEYYDPNDAWALNARAWDFESMYVYKTSDGAASRTWLTFADFPTYRHVRIPTVQGRPIYVAWTPSKTLGFYPIPVADLTFVGDYYLKPQVLANNADEPRMPSEYHMAIVWRAVMFWCASEENPALFVTAERNFNSLLLKMEVTELEGPFQAEPLA